MASDSLFDLCLPILQDDKLDEEDKTDKLEDLIRRETELTGQTLERAVLDVLWRYRNATPIGLPVATSSSAGTAPLRHTVVKKNSPAPWQAGSRSGTPINASSPRSSAASPAPPPGLGVRPALFRMRSSQYSNSPFTSPRPSPRLAYATPQIPHSPNLNAYEFSDKSPTPDIYGDYGSDTVDWLVNDDAMSNTSSSYNGEVGGAAGGEWVSPQTVEMSPYDILRSVLRDEKSDEEIERVLESNGYDLSAAIMSLMDGHSADSAQVATGLAQHEKGFLVGKSMTPGSRPATPAGQQKSPIVCRYWLQSGQCLRADCRFSHNLSNHVCKYWLAGNCLAGESCVFSHDPSSLLGDLSLNGSPYAMTPPLDTAQQNFHLQDYTAFPSLQGLSSQQSPSSSFESSLRKLYTANDSVAPPPGFSSRPALAPEFIPSQPRSSPSSQHNQTNAKASNISVDDSEAFPTLGSAAVRGPKKHHGKRGHGHGHREKENAANSLADVVRMAPASNTTTSPRKGLKTRGSYTNSRENSAAALAIPAPEHLPWLEMGENVNKAYMKARSDAIKHGGARNKFLQSAAQAWNRNDVRAAKALSLRGQSENDLMREAHRTAARALFEDRNKHLSSATHNEVYVDLHGLHPAEAATYLASAIRSQLSSSALHRDSGKYLYAIVGAGHHSKNGKDKVSRSVKTHLTEARFAFREFSTPGDKGGSGGILGIDVASGEVGKIGVGGPSVDGEDGTPPPVLQHGKVRILKAEDVDIAGL